MGHGPWPCPIGFLHGPMGPGPMGLQYGGIPALVWPSYSLVLHRHPDGKSVFWGRHAVQQSWRFSSQGLGQEGQKQTLGPRATGTGNGKRTGPHHKPDLATGPGPKAKFAWGILVSYFHTCCRIWPETSLDRDLTGGGWVGSEGWGFSDPRVGKNLSA